MVVILIILMIKSSHISSCTINRIETVNDKMYTKTTTNDHCASSRDLQAEGVCKRESEREVTAG